MTHALRARLLSQSWRILLALQLAWAADVAAQMAPTPVAAPTAPPPLTAPPPPDTTGIQPFGANLFTGNFLQTREDGLNPNYVVARGDQVAVYAWGSIELKEIYTVDAQGNIFLPGIGPVRLEGVRNADLSKVVRTKIKEVYINNFSVYTNLVTSQPVSIYVTGLVNHPGRYAGLPTDTILFFLDLAGGIDPAMGSFRSIEVHRNDKVLARADLYDFLLNGRIPRVRLMDGDTILVKKRGPVIELDGTVARPALIELTPKGRTGRDLLAVVPKAAGAVEVSLVGYRAGQPYNRTLSVKDFSALTLEDGDRVVLSDAGLAPTILVKVSGEHLGAPVLSVKRGARLVDVLNHIGIDPELADTGAIHILRPSVARAQKDSIDDSLLRLERDALLTLSGSRGEVEIRAKEADLTQRFIERAKLIEPLGRVVTARNGRQQNIPLEPEDTIVIPRKTDVVRVAGQVMMSQALVHDAHLTVSDYIEMSGGYSDRADKGRVLLVRQSAEIAMTDLDAYVGPGDEILVLPKADTKWIQGAADIVDIIFKIAVAANVAMDL